VKKALLTRITGQDGAYLAEFLLRKGYKVHGVKRRSSLFNTARIDHLFTPERNPDKLFTFSYGDLTDATNLIRIIQDFQPDEIYNLAAQSHVKVSFDTPEYTGNADGLGTLRLLEALRILGMKDARIYQASTSELYGKVQETPQKETTPFYPRSPYGVAKLYAYWITINYREAYGMHASNGILFNHESPIRGETFVTRKITRAAASIALGLQKSVSLGNLNAIRDWGHAKDFVQAMWLILQQDVPDDYVIATGVGTTVREFVQKAFACIGLHVAFRGEGVNETGVLDSIDREVFEREVEASPNGLKPGQVLVSVDPFYFRPTEVDLLIGDATKARQKLGWAPTHTIDDIVRDMMKSDMRATKQATHLRQGGFKIFQCVEDIL